MLLLPLAPCASAPHFTWQTKVFYLILTPSAFLKHKKKSQLTKSCLRLFTKHSGDPKDELLPPKDDVYQAPHAFTSIPG